MAAIKNDLRGLSLTTGSPKELVYPEDYQLSPQSSITQKLSPLDMNMPRLYGGRWILYFPLPDGANNAEIFETLREGLAHTISSIPWIAGDIGPEKGSEPSANQIQVTEGKGGVEFRYKDLTNVLSYAKLKEERFPFVELPTALVSPLQVIQSSQPVLAAQANFIEGGLLTVGVHHSVCDATGQDAILEIWASNTSAAGSSGPFSTYDPVSNDRKPLCQGLPAKIDDFPEYIIHPTPLDAGSHMAPQNLQMPPMTSKIFYFSSVPLEQLKTAAKAYSTNDALYAFFWHHITAARNPDTDGNDSDKASNMCFGVNIRCRTSPPLPPTYLGNACLAAITDRLPVSQLKEPGSGLILAAAAIRKALNKTKTPNRVPLTIGLLSYTKFSPRGRS